MKHLEPAAILLTTLCVLALLFMGHARAAGQSIPPQFQGLPAASADSIDYSAQYPMSAMPAEGGNFLDPTFGVTYTRIARPPGATSGNFVPEYARVQAWNSDNTRLYILQTTGQFWHLYDAKTLQWIRKITFPHQPNNGIMPANTSPDLVYYFSGMSLYKLDVRNDSEALIFTIQNSGTYPNPYSQCPPAIYECGEECYLSDDDTKVAAYGWCPQNSLSGSSSLALEVSVIGFLTTTPRELAHKTVAQLAPNVMPYGQGNGHTLFNDLLDNVTVSPAGDWVFFKWFGASNSTCAAVTSADKRGAGVDLWSLDLSTAHQDYVACPGPSHIELGYDVNGKEILVGFWPKTGMRADSWTVRYLDLNNAAVQNTVTLPCAFTYYTPCNTAPAHSTYYHFSLRNIKQGSAALGWGFMSTYAPPNVAWVANQGWGGSENIAIRFDTTLADSSTWRRIGRNFSIRSGDYYGEPHAVWNRDGTAYLFGSNWFTAGGQDFPFVVNMPQGCAQ